MNTLRITALRKNILVPWDTQCGPLFYMRALNPTVKTYFLGEASWYKGFLLSQPIKSCGENKKHPSKEWISKKKVALLSTFFFMIIWRKGEIKIQEGKLSEKSNERRGSITMWFRGRLPNIRPKEKPGNSLSRYEPVRDWPLERSCNTRFSCWKAPQKSQERQTSNFLRSV